MCVSLYTHTHTHIYIYISYIDLKVMPKVMSNKWYRWDSNLKVSLATYLMVFWHTLKPRVKLCQLNTSHLEKWADRGLSVLITMVRFIHSEDQLLCLGWCYLNWCLSMHWKDRSSDSLKASKEGQTQRKGVSLRMNFVYLPTVQNNN